VGVNYVSGFLRCRSSDKKSFHYIRSDNER
jgi:hypothetical protein